MSKYFRPWNIDQTLLLPPNVQDFVPKGHVSRFIVELVRESLDLKEITGSYVSGLGQPPFDPRMMVALGIHVGDIIIDENDIFGDGVNIAARLEGIAEPGGVCISDDAQRQIRGQVDIAFDDMGPQTLKNIAEPMRAWRMQIDPNLSSTAAAKPLAEAAQPLALP